MREMGLEGGDLYKEIEILGGRGGRSWTLICKEFWAIVVYRVSRMWLLKHELVGLDSERGVVSFYGFFFFFWCVFDGVDLVVGDWFISWI